MPPAGLVKGQGEQLQGSYLKSEAQKSPQQEANDGCINSRNYHSHSPKPTASSLEGIPTVQIHTGESGGGKFDVPLLKNQGYEHSSFLDSAYH